MTLVQKLTPEALRLLDAGHTTSDIAGELECSNLTILRIIHANGRTPNRPAPKWTDERIAELKRLRASGMATSEIARKMKIGKGAVAGKCARLELEAMPVPAAFAGPKPADPAMIRRAELMAAAGRGRTTIARMCGITNSQAAKVIKSKGVAVLPIPPRRAVPDLFVVVSAPVVAAPLMRGGCDFPMWADNERPKFRADGSPLVCGQPRGRGSYCLCHASVCFSRIRVAA